MAGIVVKNLQDADERVTFDHGRLDLIKASSLAIGREVLEEPALDMPRFYRRTS